MFRRLREWLRPSSTLRIARRLNASLADEMPGYAIPDEAIRLMIRASEARCRAANLPNIDAWLVDVMFVRLDRRAMREVVELLEHEVATQEKPDAETTA